VSPQLHQFATLASSARRFPPPLACLGRAVVFGGTLRGDAMASIERMARRGQPDLSLALCRDTRGARRRQQRR
jgi:uncharacterized membrane protein